MTFLLGTHQVDWLAKTDVPLFISHRRLANRKSFPKALGKWGLDSGGFTELSLNGGWTVSPKDYVASVRRYKEEIGNLQWASPQDWMCEPFMLNKTGKTVTEHQARTVGNYLDLKAAAPDLPFIPVLQGWSLIEYGQCADLYERAGVDLTKEPLVGIGSVCRRQHMDEAAIIIESLAARGIRLHGFGFKITGLKRVGHYLYSSDSMAWSLNARKNPPLLGCTHRSCSNCLRFALKWRQKPLAAIAEAEMKYGRPEWAGLEQAA